MAQMGFVGDDDLAYLLGRYAGKRALTCTVIRSLRDCPPRAARETRPRKGWGEARPQAPHGIFLLMRRSVSPNTGGVRNGRSPILYWTPIFLEHGGGNLARISADYS